MAVVKAAPVVERGPEDTWIAYPLKKKYRTAHRGTFKSNSRTNAGKKKLTRPAIPAGPLAKSNIHQPKKAQWPKHFGGTWSHR